MKNDHAPKSGGVEFFNIKKKCNFWKNSSLTILFISIDFSSLQFFSSFVF